MKSKVLLFTTIVLLQLLLATGCSEKLVPGPEITWSSVLGTVTYSYAGGALSGLSINQKFTVTNDQSGEIKITAKCGGTTESCTGYVESGKTYKLVITCTIGERDQSSTIHLESKAARQPLDIDISGYSVNVKILSIKEA